MLVQIRDLVEAERLDREAVERTLGVRLVATPDPSGGARDGYYTAIAARAPIVAACPPFPSGVTQRFLFRQDYRLADLFIPLRSSSALTEDMIAEAFRPPWGKYPAFQGGATVYWFEGKESRYVVSFYMGAPCDEVWIQARPKNEVRIDVPASRDDDKADFLAFLKRFMAAVEDDAFLQPERLKAVLGIDVLEWIGDANVWPFDRYTRRLRTNVPVLDHTDIGNQLLYSIVPRERRYVFRIDRMAHVLCVDQTEVEGAIGEPNVLYGGTHGSSDRFGNGYSFPSASFRSKVAAFFYVSKGGASCLDSVVVIPIPLKREVGAGKLSRGSPWPS